MIVFLNGKFVPEEQALVSVFDRGFLYGDGLFETMLIANGVPFRWREHWERLERGAAFLRIALPFGTDELKSAAQQLIKDNRLPEALLRLTLSRGIGLRGYSPSGANSPAMVMTLHPVNHPKPLSLNRWRLKTSTFRLPAGEPLAQFKTCNKLAQILARSQAEDSQADEALLLNTDGFVVEGASSNLFWIRQETVYTPPLASGILSGVTRLVVLELCAKLNIEVQESSINANELVQTDGVFLSLSSFGIVEGASLDGRPLQSSPIVESLLRAYFEEVERESSQSKC